MHRQEILHTIDVVHETSRANTVSLVASLTTVIGSSSLRRFASSSSVRPIQRCTSTPLLSRKPQEATTTWCYCLFRQSSKNGHIQVFCTWALMIFSLFTSRHKMCSSCSHRFLLHQCPASRALALEATPAPRLSELLKAPGQRSLVPRLPGSAAGAVRMCFTSLMRCRTNVVS